MHVVVNPTWRCQLACPYCWLPHTRIVRGVAEHTWQQWIIALGAALPPRSIIDISGGEPLLFDGLPELLLAIGSREMAWAITTNALHTSAVERLIKLHPLHCAAINVSDHVWNERARENIDRLRAAGYPVNVNRVSHPKAGHHEPGGAELPYQDWEAGTALDGIARHCDAGLNHWVADPAGNVWRCQVSMQLGHPPLANLFTDERHTVDMLCGYGCSTCYRDTPEAWHIKMGPTCES